MCYKRGVGSSYHAPFAKEIIVKKLFTSLAVAIALLIVATDAHAFGVYGSYWDAKDLDGGFGIGARHRMALIPLLGADLRAA